MSRIVDELFVFAAHNTLIALILAALVFCATRVWRNPPVAHVLWLLVLVRLIVPPVVCINGVELLPARVTKADRPSSVEVARTDSYLLTTDRLPVSAGADGDLRHEQHPRVIQRHIAGGLVSASTARSLIDVLAESLTAIWESARSLLLWVWFGGAACFALIVARRILRFERLLRDTLPSPARLERMAQEIAARMGVTCSPRICYVESIDIPLVWCAGRRPTIVLPMRLFQQLDDRAAGMIIAHELAHLRRHDHWVRGLEMVVATLYWWNPLMWLIRRQIHDVEDQCCDAWVRRVFPDCEQIYAEVLLQTAEMLNSPRAITALPGASPLFHSFSLKARIEMILNGRFAPRIARMGLVVVALFGMLVVPSFLPDRKAKAGSEVEIVVADSAKKTVGTEKTDATARSEFPHVVKFEQGATDFLKGDGIEIVEVRGTTEKFERGNIYWIRGTYTLASHERAMLAAYTTVSVREHATSVSLKVQSTVVPRGKGTFTLFLPMPYDGWPHVSFYPAEGGNGFGENYFGTGDSVKKPVARPQAAKGPLPHNVTYTWTDSEGKRHVEHWSAKDEDRHLTLVEQTTSGTNLPIVDGDPADRTEMPTTDEILRSLPTEPSHAPPFLTKVERNNVRIAVEKIGDKIDECRFYPLVGPARKRSCHYKCTVSYDKVSRSDWPVPFSRTEPKVVQVVYVDHDHLIRASGPK